MNNDNAAKSLVCSNCNRNVSILFVSTRHCWQCSIRLANAPRIETGAAMLDTGASDG
jgi:hypothetical protein